MFNNQELKDEKRLVNTTTLVLVGSRHKSKNLMYCEQKIFVKHRCSNYLIFRWLWQAIMMATICQNTKVEIVAT